jgi:hypothetical protein
MVDAIRMLSYGLSLGTPMGSYQDKRNKFVLFSLLCFFVGLYVSGNHQEAKAQLIPVPPPVQQPKPTQADLGAVQVNNSTSSPTIQVLTTSLLEGGNVFRVKITDRFDLRSTQITYVQNGQIVTQGLVRDPNNIYKALINAHLPSAVIITTAVDTQGKSESVVKVLDVTPLPNSILGQITNFLYGVGKSIVSIFGFTK